MHVLLSELLTEPIYFLLLLMPVLTYIFNPNYDLFLT